MTEKQDLLVQKFLQAARDGTVFIESYRDKDLNYARQSYLCFRKYYNITEGFEIFRGMCRFLNADIELSDRLESGRSGVVFMHTISDRLLDLIEAKVSRRQLVMEVQTRLSAGINA